MKHDAGQAGRGQPFPNRHPSIASAPLTIQDYSSQYNILADNPRARAGYVAASTTCPACPNGGGGKGLYMTEGKEVMSYEERHLKQKAALDAFLAEIALQVPNTSKRFAVLSKFNAWMEQTLALYGAACAEALHTNEK